MKDYDFTDGRPATFHDALPEQVDVVIIGAGVIGISAAWYLLQRGKSVLVCEKGRVAGEQSSRNWGWIRVTGRDPDEVPLAIESLQCWKQMAAEIEDDLGFRENQGVMALTERDDEMAGFAEWTALARDFDLDTRIIDRREVQASLSDAAGNWKGGIVTPSDARAEPFKAVPAIARDVKKKGGFIRENCAVRNIHKQAGVVSEVETEAGTVRTNQVICAAGGWSSLFLSNLGIRFPQLVVQGTVARTEAAPAIFASTVGLQDIFVRRRNDGGYTVASGMTTHIIGAASFKNMFRFMPALGSASDIGIKLGQDPTQRALIPKTWGNGKPSPFERHRVLNPRPETRALRKMRTNFDKRLPRLAGTKFVQSWSGMIDATPDVVPVIDRIESWPGLFLASGFSGHGFGIGPGAGRVMADMVCGNLEKHDLNRFRFARFSDGSKMRPGPAI